jgi:hypothetical protein
MTRHGLWFLWAALGTAACGNVVSPAASPEDASVADRQTGDDHATPNADGSSPEHDARQALDGGGARDSTVTPDDVGTVAPDGGTRSWSPICPPNAPEGGTSCSSSGATCEYPNTVNAPTVQVDINCNLVLACDDGAWAMAPSPGGSCNPDGPNAASCPASFASIHGGTGCDSAGVRCTYPDGTCLCTTDLAQLGRDGGARAGWYCGPDTGAGCPVVRPRLGSACAAPDVDCSYALCIPSEMCTSAGVWQQGAGSCP